MDLKKYIKELVHKELDEMSTTSGGETYSTPFAFAKKGQGANLATKNAEKSGWKLAGGMPKSSKMLDYKELWPGKKSAMNEEVTGAVKNSGRRYIPKEFMFPAELRGEHFKLIKRGDEYVMLISHLAKISLEAIEKGRTSFEKEQKLSELTRLLKDKLPAGARMAIKNGIKFGKIDPNNKMIPVNATITRVDDNKNIYIKNPAFDDSADIQPKIYEVNEILQNIIKEELLKEVTYGKFKKDVKHRTKSEQLHKAIREVKRKLAEIDRIVEYTSRMKQELSEDGGINYWKATQKNVASISEMVNKLNNKIKNLNQ